MVFSQALMSSSLGRFPTELRLIIWEYSMNCSDLVVLHHGETSVNNLLTSKDSSSTTTDGLELNVYAAEESKPTTASSLSLTQICKQMRHETMPIYLSSTSFLFHCPIFDNSTSGHGVVDPTLIASSRHHLATWLQSLDTSVPTWSSHVQNLTLDFGLWQILSCKSSPQPIISALTTFSAAFPPQRNRVLKVKIAVQWRAICPCCESGKNDESVWPLVFELERGKKNDGFFQAVTKTCGGKAEWIVKKEGICGRTRVGWLMQLERTSVKLVEFLSEVQRCGIDWTGIEEMERVTEVEVEGDGS